MELLGLLGRVVAFAGTIGAFLMARRVAATRAGVPRAYVPFRRFAVPAQGLPRWARPAVAVPGIAAVYLVAAVFFGAAIKVAGEPYYDPTINVTPGGAAELAGIRSGDRVLRVAGLPVSTLDDAWDFIGQRRKADPLEIVVERGAVEVAITVPPPSDTRRSQIGINPRFPPRVASIGVGTAIVQGLATPAQFIADVAQAFESSTGIDGPRRIHRLSRAEMDSPPSPSASLLRIMGYLSLFLGLLLVPISIFGWRPSE